MTKNGGILKKISNWKTGLPSRRQGYKLVFIQLKMSYRFI